MEKQTPFTDEEILKLSAILKPSDLWFKAFQFYNNESGHRRLSMGCGIFFNKVLVFILQKRFSEK